MTISLIPYRYNSQSAQRLRQVFTTWRYNKPADINVNFGSSQKNYPCTLYVNHPSKVAVAIDKYKCFMALYQHVNVPRFTKFKHRAESFTRPIYERHKLRSTKGRGITVNHDQPLGNARMFVEGLPIKREYRVIVLNNSIVTTMMKVPRHSRNPSFEIRNLDNGWRYSYKTPYPQELKSVTTLAIKALSVLELQFGAVDIVVTPDYIPYVLEVNTAFGLGKRNTELFSDALNTYITTLQEEHS